MRRPLEPYVAILEDFISGRIDAWAFRNRTIEQYDRTDAGTCWTQEWGAEVAAVLERMDGDAEVYYPECPDQSYITLEELQHSSRENLRRLRIAIASATPAA